MNRPDSPVGQDGLSRLKPLAIKFAAVGILNTAAHVLVTVCLVELLSVHPVPASVAGFIVAVSISFFLNTYWTFRQSDNLRSRFFRFLIVSVSAMLLNTLIMYYAVDVFEVHYMAGLGMVLMIVPIYNFWLNYFWSFRAE